MKRRLSLSAVSIIAATLLASAPLAHAQSATPHSAVLNWTAPTVNTVGAPETNPLVYNVYELVGDTTPQPAAVLPSTAVKIATGINALTYTVTQAVIAGTGTTVGAIADGSTHCFTITAVDGVQEGPGSNSVCATFPAAPGSAVLTLGTVK